MRAYDWPFIAKKYGTEASLFHVTREMASVNDMMDGGYGAKVHLALVVCAPAGHA